MNFVHCLMSLFRFSSLISLVQFSVLVAKVSYRYFTIWLQFS